MKEEGWFDTDDSLAPAAQSYWRKQVATKTLLLSPATDAIHQPAESMKNDCNKYIEYEQIPDAATVVGRIR